MRRFWGISGQVVVSSRRTGLVSALMPQRLYKAQPGKVVDLQATRSKMCRQDDALNKA